MKLFKRKAEERERKKQEVRTIEEVMRDAEYEYDSPSAHLLDVLEDLHYTVRWRYEAGQERNGGRLWRKECLSRLKDEIADAFVYLSTLEHQIEAINDIIYEARGGKLDPRRALDAISSILQCGNPYGELEEDKPECQCQEESEDDE